MRMIKEVSYLIWNERHLSACFKTVMTLVEFMISITSGVSLRYRLCMFENMLNYDNNNNNIKSRKLTII